MEDFPRGVQWETEIKIPLLEQSSWPIKLRYIGYLRKVASWKKVFSAHVHSNTKYILTKLVDKIKSWEGFSQYISNVEHWSHGYCDTQLTLRVTQAVHRVLWLRPNSIVTAAAWSMFEKSNHEDKFWSGYWNASKILHFKVGTWEPEKIIFRNGYLSASEIPHFEMGTRVPAKFQILMWVFECQQKTKFEMGNWVRAKFHILKWVFNYH